MAMAQHHLRQPQRCPSPTNDIDDKAVVISADHDDMAGSGGGPSDATNLRVYRLCKRLSSSSFSPESVITHMGRNYDAKDYFSSLASLESPPSDSTTTTARRPDGPAQRIPVGRTKSATALVVPRMPQRQQQRSHSGSLAEMRRSLTFGCSIFSNKNSNNTPSNEESALQSLNYSHDDVVSIVDDRQEFELLKASLKKQGAVTNEILRQGLHFYVKAKKDRDASGIDPTQQQQQQQRRRVVRRSKSDMPTTRRATLSSVRGGEREHSQKLHASISGNLTAEYRN